MARPTPPEKRDRLTAEIARATWSYDPDTGVLRWKVSRKHSKMKPGDIAGCSGPDNHIIVSYGSPPGQIFQATGIIWLIVTGDWPRDQVDHKDCDPANNRWDNLREATHQQNMHNRPIQKNNKSGYKGVHWDKETKKWRAGITINGRRRQIGSFDTPEAAAIAYRKVAMVVQGEFHRFQ